MELYYKSSEGVIINLIGNEYKMLSETDLFNSEWQYETVGTNYPYISAFKNQMVSKSCTLIVSGATNDDLKDNLEHLIEVLDRDVRLGQVGAIYYGNYYRECYCTATEKGKIEGKTKTSIGLTFVAEDGDWKSEQLSSYSGLSGGKYLNNYAVPIPSSNENDYSYGENIETSEDMFVTSVYYKQSRIYIGSSDTVRIKEIDHTIRYRTSTTGNWVEIAPNQCPYDIDVSDIPLYVSVAGNLVPAFIEVIAYDVPNTSTTNYVLIADKNMSTMDWQNAEDDHQPTITFDLGSIIEIKKISGLDLYVGYHATSSTEAYLQISANGSEWTSVDTQSIPTDNSTVELSKTWSSDYPSVRYIRVASSLISGTDYGEFAIRTKHFQVEAHFTGENQNLATSCVVSSAPNQTYIVTEEGVVELYKRYTDVGIITKIDFTLAKTTTVVEINNLTLTNNDSASRTFVVYGDNNVLDTVTVNANSSTSYSWSGEEELSTISLGVKAQNFEISSSNFEILEEQTEAPHRYILNENYVPSDAIIKIYGATLSPSIMIGDNQYGAENITLDDGEYLEINTKDETIQHYVDSEGWVNVFNHRLDDTFEKIEVGTSEITWQGNLDIDIRLLNSRSDPKWN